MRNPWRAELVAELKSAGVGGVVANDAERRSFTVRSGGSLLLVSGDDLGVIHHWQIRAEPPLAAFNGWGSHSSTLEGPLALLSTPDAVRLLEPDGSVRWSFTHASWVGLGIGCAWFDATGRPFAVVAAGDGTVCRIVALDLASGIELAESHVMPSDPSGMMPLHQPGGWVGIAESEGENASRVWWTRWAERDLDVLPAPWDDEHLCDMHASGARILTTALDSGRLRVRAFPSLEVIRDIDVEGEDFILSACFVHSAIAARLYYKGVTVAIDEQDRIHELEVDDGWLVPATGGSWLSARKETLRRWALV